MNALYRAALGPIGASYYLPLFARFDAAGRTFAGWNWAASLCTLNWMAWRRLWGAALVYLAAAEGLVLLVFGVGHPLLHWPGAVERGFAAVFATLALVVPGLYGNAILHTEIRKRITRALAVHRTIPEACALLAREAASWKRLALLVLANAVLLAAVAGAVLVLPQDNAPGTTSDHGAPTPATEVTAPREVATSVPAEVAVQNSPALAAEPQPAASSPPQPPAVPDAPPPANPASGTVPQEATASVPPPPAPALGTAAGYYINIGLFAEESNARKAQAQLLNEGLPAFRQALTTAKGQRIRVRVGPISTEQEARAASHRIGRLGLDAVIFKQ